MNFFSRRRSNKGIWGIRRIRVNTDLPKETLSKLEGLLRNNADVFAWCPSDMTSIPRDVAEHELKIPPNVKPVV